MLYILIIAFPLKINFTRINNVPEYALRKLPHFHLISWYGNFVERHSFRIVSNHPKLCGNCAFPQNFHTRKLGEITVLYAVPVQINGLESSTRDKGKFGDFRCLRGFEFKHLHIINYTKSHFQISVIVYLPPLCLIRWWLFWTIKGTIMQIWKSPYIFVFIQKQYPEYFAFLILRILELLREVCKFLKKVG